jgi:hypothetical protein
MLRANKDPKGHVSSTAQQLADNKAAPAADGNSGNFREKENEFQINNALKSLLSALQSGKTAIDANDEKSEKPRRVLLCLGEKKEEVAEILTSSGYRVYLAANARAGERTASRRQDRDRSILARFRGGIRGRRDHSTKSERDVHV